MRHLTTAVTALALVVGCSAFTSTHKSKYNESYSTGRRCTRKSPFTPPHVFINNQLNIRRRDSSLAFNSGYLGDISVINVLFFLSVYSFGIYATIQSSEDKVKKTESLDVMPVIEKVSMDVEDSRQSVEDNVKIEKKANKKVSGPIKNVIKRILKSPDPVHDVKEESSSAEKEIKPLEEEHKLVEKQSEKLELEKIEPNPADKTSEPIKVELEPLELDTPKEINTDFTEIKEKVASTPYRYPDITETLKRVASTKESEEIKLRLLAQNRAEKEEVQSISSRDETNTPPESESKPEDKMEISTPKRKGFRNKVKRIAKKVIMPWRKFSEIQ